jgi:pectinesterase
MTRPALLLALLVVAAFAPAGAQRWTAVVDAGFAGQDGARVAGAPTYRTLGAALARLPASGPASVYLRDGRYREKLVVRRPRVTLVGQSRDGVVLTWEDASGMPRAGGGTLGTFGSYTLRVAAPDFRAEHLTIENAFDYLANARKASDDPTKLQAAQAVALALDSASDRASFEDVRVTGHQDTLYPNAGRAYFHRCEIAGSVDFIFGAGVAVFDDCDVVSRDRGSPTNNGYVAAPSTPLRNAYGFLFVKSRLKKETPAMAPNSVVLGRPWHAGGDPQAVGSAVFVDCWMDDHVGARRWDRMRMGSDSAGNAVWAEPGASRFYEYHSTGPGAVAGPRRLQLTDADAARYTVERVLDGWAPSARR